MDICVLALVEFYDALVLIVNVLESLALVGLDVLHDCSSLFVVELSDGLDGLHGAWTELHAVWAGQLCLGLLGARRACIDLGLACR